jgi:hypothetical protein
MRQSWLVSLSLLLAIPFLAPAPTPAQTNVAIAIARGQAEPVEVVKAVYTSPEHWARTLHITVRGTGQKPITLVELALELPELQDDGHPFVGTLRFGDPKKKKPDAVKPGKEMKIEWDQKSCERFDALLYGVVYRDFPIRDQLHASTIPTSSGSVLIKPTCKVALTRGTISIKRVVFEDGSVWEGVR